MDLQNLDLQNLSQFELRQICYFMTVVQAGNNFSQAAQHLGIKQPPLSQRILALEELLSDPKKDYEILQEYFVVALPETHALADRLQDIKLTREIAVVWRAEDHSIVLREFLKTIQNVMNLTFRDSW